MDPATNSDEGADPATTDVDPTTNYGEGIDPATTNMDLATNGGGSIPGSGLGVGPRGGIDVGT